MPARKAAKKSTTKKSSKARAGARVDTGLVPPYGEAIRGAVARGDVQEMKDAAASARKWISDTQSALKQLDSAIKKSGKK
jgi:hypothetical protein